MATDGFDFSEGGHVTYPDNDLFDLGQGAGLTVEFRIRFTGESQMPVVIGAGQWNHAGWFVQQIGNGLAMAHRRHQL